MLSYKGRIELVRSADSYVQATEIVYENFSGLELSIWKEIVKLDGLSFSTHIALYCRILTHLADPIKAGTFCKNFVNEK